MTQPDYFRAESAARNVAHHSAIAMARLDLGRDDDLDRKWVVENIAKAAAAMGYVLAPMMPDQPKTDADYIADEVANERRMLKGDGPGFRLPHDPVTSSIKDLGYDG